MGQRPEKNRLQPLGVFSRVLLLLALTAVIAVVSGFAGMHLILNGPESARNELVRTFEETSRGKIILRWFMDDATIKSISNRTKNDVKSDVDSGLIHIGKKYSGDVLPENDSYLEVSSDVSSEIGKESGMTEDGITLIDISGPAYKGKLMIVDDPLRVFVGTNTKYGQNMRGLEVNEFIEKYNAVAGMNAGGFSDSGGTGNGGTPSGIVISDGKIVWGGTGNSYSICGFDANGILHVGIMTGATALKKGIVSACSFGPALIMNGVPCNAKSSFNTGRNPRTAIGQRSDGAILLLVIEGRQVDSLGANYDELVDILYSHGAVNATNLDGGSSTIMFYKGECVIRPSTIAASSRGVATAIIVK